MPSDVQFSLFFVLLLVMLRVLLHFIVHHPFVGLDTGDRSVYVPGGGFSGFWFLLGQLQSMPDPMDQEYYCFSAGCLAVAATLGNYSMEQMYSNARSVQRLWLSCDVHRHDVVSTFLNSLILDGSVENDYNESTTTDWNDPALLSKMNIITTVKNQPFGLTAEIRKPSSAQELRTMLIQTTWIPFILGSDLFYQGHMDGAFSMSYHPACAHEVGLVNNPDLLVNVVNANLGREKVEKFWNMGLTSGA